MHTFSKRIFFFFNDTATTEIYTLPLHDALPILGKLKPSFKKGGSVTAGNSSSLNDGAAAVLVVAAEYARAHGLEPLAKIRSMASAGVPPRVMGIGPLPATRKALDRAGIAFEEIGRAHV